MVPGGVGRGDDGRLRRARVHGARARRARTRWRCPTGLRRERGGRERRGRSPSRAARAPGRARARWTLPARRRSTRSRPCWGCPPGALIKALPGDRRGARARAGAGARRPPAERDQAPERPRRALPPGTAEEVASLSARRPASSARSGAGPRCWRTRRSAASGSWWPVPTSPTSTCAGSSPAVTSSPTGCDVRSRRGRGHGAERRQDPHRACDRGGQHLQARHPLSVPLGATYLDEDGKEQPIWMGSYGIGPARIMAAAVEQFADEHGISWPRSSRPFDVELVDAGQGGRGGARRGRPPLRGAARRRARRALRRPRPRARARSSPTPSCSGCPLRLTVGKRSVEAGELEAQVRRGPREALAAARRRRRRQSRSCGASSPDAAAPPAARPRPPAAPPPETLAGAPLNPWTIPNAIGFIRLALIPVFLVLALESGDGRSTAAVIIYAVIGWTDYARRHGRADHRPVQPPRRAARSGRRPAAGHLRRHRRAGTSSCCRAGRSPSRRARAVHAGARPVALKHGVDLEDQHARPLGRLADDVLAVLRDGRSNAGSETPALPRPGDDAGATALYLRDGLRAAHAPTLNY